MPRKKKARNLESLNGCKLRKDKQRLTPGEAVIPSHAEVLEAPKRRHPDLMPVTLSGLIDAFKLNEIAFKHRLDGQYECHVSAGGVDRVINPYDGSECLSFFRDVICQP